LLIIFGSDRDVIQFSMDWSSDLTHLNWADFEQQRQFLLTNNVTITTATKHKEKRAICIQQSIHNYINHLNNSQTLTTVPKTTMLSKNTCTMQRDTATILRRLSPQSTCETTEPNRHMPNIILTNFQVCMQSKFRDSLLHQFKKKSVTTHQTYLENKNDAKKGLGGAAARPGPSSLYQM